MRLPRIKRAVVTLWLLCVSSCALFGGGEVALQRAEGYTFKIPTGWKKKNQNESDQAYKLPSQSLVTLNSSCHRHADAPLEVLTRQLLMGSRNVVTERRETMAADGSPGLYSAFTATFEGTRFHLDIFVTSVNECIFDFSLVSPRELTNQDRAEFISFIKSFHYGIGQN
jgi:predicted Zn-dependent protease